MRSRTPGPIAGRCARDEIAEGLPHFVALDGAEGLAPGIEAFQRDARMHDRRQIVGHEFERRMQQIGDVVVGLGEGVLQRDHALEPSRHAPLVEQHGADLAEYAGAGGEPAGHVERRRHRLHAGQIDAASVGRRP